MFNGLKRLPVTFLFLPSVDTNNKSHDCDILFLVFFFTFINKNKNVISSCEPGGC